MNKLTTIVLAAVLGACGSSEDDGRSTPGAVTLVFVPDARQDGPSIRLEQKELSNTRLVLDVVADDVSTLYGLAFRLQIDPGVLALEELKAGPVWSSVPQKLTRAKLAPPDTIVGVVSAKGEHAGVAADDQVIATLSLTRTTRAPTTLRFHAAPSAAVGMDALEIPGVAWYGGALTSSGAAN